MSTQALFSGGRFSLTLNELFSHFKGNKLDLAKYAKFFWYGFSFEYLLFYTCIYLSVYFVFSFEYLSFYSPVFLYIFAILVWSESQMQQQEWL